GAALMTGVGAAVGSWSSALMGATVQDPVRRKFEEAIEGGQVLLGVDGEDEQLAIADAAIQRAGATQMPYEGSSVASCTPNTAITHRRGGFNGAADRLGIHPTEQEKRR